MPDTQHPSALWARLQRWRWKHGILTGRWTAEEVARHYAVARQRRMELGLVCSSCGGDFDTRGCVPGLDGLPGHTVYGGVAAAQSAYSAATEASS